MSDFDVIIAGGSHNGLACASMLAVKGLKVLVLEKNEWVGGGAVTQEIVAPGFKHDLFSSSHIFIHMNPDFNQHLRPELEKFGLKYLWGEDKITGHPFADGPGVVVYKDVERTCDSIAQYSRADAATYRKIVDDFAEIRDGFIRGVFSPPNLPSLQPAAMERSPEGLRRLREFNLSARAFVEEKFENDAIRALILGWSLAPHTRPDQEGMGAGFYVMVPSVHHYGQAIPEGGSQQLPLSMCRLIESRGGMIVSGADIAKFIISDGRCKGVRTADGNDYIAKHGVVTALDPTQTFLRLIDEEHLTENFRTAVRHFSYSDHGIARIHLALNERPQFREESLDGIAFHRFFGSVDKIRHQFAEIELGELPSEPNLVYVNWTIRDPSRAPAGKHTLSLDTVVPSKLRSGKKWDDVKEAFGETMLNEVRKHVTNLDSGNIINSVVHTPEDLFRYNRSFVNGSPTGGERTLAQWGAFRPFPGYSQYKSPIRGLYMTGPHCHPGNGISAMGTITANVLLKDLGV